MFAIKKSLKPVQDKGQLVSCAEMQGIHGEFPPKQSFAICVVLCDNF